VANAGLPSLTCQTKCQGKSALSLKAHFGCVAKYLGLVFLGNPEDFRLE